MRNHYEKSIQPDMGPKVWFTGKSLDYIGDLKLPVSLEEWEWHEELIDGYPGCIITDKIRHNEFREKEVS